MQQNGNTIVKVFRDERFVKKTVKLAATISRRNLPYMNFKPNSDKEVQLLLIFRNTLFRCVFIKLSLPHLKM